MAMVAMRATNSSRLQQRRRRRRHKGGGSVGASGKSAGAARPCQHAARASSTSSAPASSSAATVSRLPFRVGHGFDLHRLETGVGKLVLAGVEIPHTKGCAAHSDGDVLLHTVTDAILGALCLPDIGQLFPDNDPKWQNQSSDVFLVEAVRRMGEMGYRLGNLDATIILQKPKVSPHKENIRRNLCAMLGADVDGGVVNIKAKTHEKVDSIGEGRSVACHAVVMLIRDGDD